VSEKINKKLNFQPVNPHWQYYDNAKPTVTSDVKPENTTPAISFGVEIKHNDLNDKFDVQHLVKLVPKLYQQKALSLLQKIEQQPSDINFDSDGVIFINSESIPSSNIFKVLPALYKKRHPKNLPGFYELVNKLKEINLKHLFVTDRLDHFHVKHDVKSEKSNSKWYFLK